MVSEVFVIQKKIMYLKIIYVANTIIFYYQKLPLSSH